MQALSYRSSELDRYLQNSTRKAPPMAAITVTALDTRYKHANKSAYNLTLKTLRHSQPCTVMKHLLENGLGPSHISFSLLPERLPIDEFYRGIAFWVYRKFLQVTFHDSMIMTLYIHNIAIFEHTHAAASVFRANEGEKQCVREDLYKIIIRLSS